MDNFNWLPIAIVAIIFLAGQGRKLVAGSRQIQAVQADRQAQMQAAADQAAAQAAQAAQATAVRAAAAAAGAAVRAAPTPPRPLPPLRTPSVPFQAAMPAEPLPALAGHAFIRAAFADPLHARRAVVLSEILLPPIALR